MAPELAFTYRLPLTYVRITGSRVDTTSTLTPDPTVECRAVVTTEAGADYLTAIRITLGEQSKATQKSTWTMLGDGRLSGADVATTVDSAAGWKASLEAAGAVLGAGAGIAAAAGPVGWAALAATATAAAVGTAVLSRGVGRDLFASLAPTDRDTRRPAPVEARPADHDVHPLYVTEHPDEAQTLANYRAAISAAEAEHARAVLAAVRATDEDYHWRERVEFLHGLLACATVGAAAAEASYVNWRLSKSTTRTTGYDERFRIDDLPTRHELQGWAEGTRTSVPVWAAVSTGLRTAMSLDLDPIPGDDERKPRIPLEPLPADTVVHRPPRPAVLRVWTLTPRPGGGFTMASTDARDVLVAYPGNEAELSIASPRRATHAAVVQFDGNGALLKVSTEISDPALQRARDVSALIPALGAAVDVGVGLRTALTPTSLVDRAAEAKAARELGLVETPADPLKALRDQLAEEQLRGQLRISQQLAAATSIPIVVTVTGAG